MERTETRDITAYWGLVGVQTWPTVDDLMEVVRGKQRPGEVLEDIGVRIERGPNAVMQLMIYLTFASGGDVDSYLHIEPRPDPLPSWASSRPPIQAYAGEDIHVGEAVELVHGKCYDEPAWYVKRVRHGGI